MRVFISLSRTATDGARITRWSDPEKPSHQESTETFKNRKKNKRKLRQIHGQGPVPPHHGITHDVSEKGPSTTIANWLGRMEWHKGQKNIRRVL